MRTTCLSCAHCPMAFPIADLVFAVNSRLGNAVRRNLIKRRLREIVRLQQDKLQPGWDVVLIARTTNPGCGLPRNGTSCARLLRRAHLFQADQA